MTGWTRAARVAMALGALGVATLELGTPAAAAPPEADPVISTSATHGAPGEHVDVTLSGFPAGSVQVAVCGDGGLGGSTACAVREAITVGIGADGMGSGRLDLAEPPAPCPCVVRATTIDNGLAAMTPMVVAGVTVAPAVPAAPPAPAELQVLSVELRRSGSLLGALGEVLGLGATRTLTVTVRNNGEVPVDARAAWAVAGGRADDAATTVGAHETVVLHETMDVPAMTVGQLDVRGEVLGGATVLPVGATTSSWPFGVAVVPLFAMIFAVDRWWHRRRRRPLRPLRLSVRAVALTAMATAVAVGVHTTTRVAASDGHAAEAQRELLADFVRAQAAPATAELVQRDLATGVTVRRGAFADDGADQQAPPVVAAPEAGALLGVLRIPRLDGDDPYEFAVVEGVSAEDLTRGPGHFPGSANPGEVGNFALSGHRRTYLAPFGELDGLVVGDSIEFETFGSTFTYRVTATDVVTPDRTDVLYPVPGRADAAPTKALITLITCHPEHSTRERLVVVGELAETTP